MEDDDGETETDPNKKPPEGDPPQDPPKDPPEGDPPKPPTAEELQAMYDRGDLLTKERNEEIVRQRLERDREEKKKEADRERTEAEQKAARDALKDQEKYKELSETQATELATKDARITELEAAETRTKDLEERLAKLVDSRVERLAKPYQDLIAMMPVEQRADWLEKNSELVSQGAAGSPPTPEANGKDKKGRKEEADKKAREDQRNRGRSRI